MVSARFLPPLIAALTLLAGCAGGAASVGASPRTAEAPSRADPARQNGRVFDAVVSLVRERYYDPHFGGLDWELVARRYRPDALAAADPDELYAVLSSLLEQLGDAHAYAQSPTEVAREDEADGSRPLFGMRVQRRGRVFMVDDVRPDGPADRAGVEVGWAIESADGQPYRVADSRVEGVPERLIFRDEAGTVHSLDVAPTIVRFGPRRRVQRLDDGTWVIGFDDFEGGSADWLFGTLRGVPAGAPVIVDLRDNLGGRIREVERTLGCFLPADTFVARMRQRDGEERLSRAGEDCPRAASGPVAVLISRRSRSGAEMFAAAVQEWRRGPVVGGRSAGALLSSLRYELPDGGRLTLSQADFLTAGGRRIERVGVIPDVAAQTTQADRRAGRDPALGAAVDALRTRQAQRQRVSAAPPEAAP